RRTARSCRIGQNVSARPNLKRASFPGAAARSAARYAAIGSASAAAPSFILKDRSRFRCAPERVEVRESRPPGTATDNVRGAVDHPINAADAEARIKEGG